MTARRLILVGTLGALAVVAALALRGASKPTVSKARPAGTENVAGLEGRLSQGRVSALERRIRELEELVPVAATPREDADEGGPRATDEPRPEPLDPEEEAALDDRKVADRESALGAEAVDPGWSGATEAMLGRTFDEAAFKGSTLQRAQCRSTFCMLVVRDEDDVARFEFERFASMAAMGGEFVVRLSADGRPETTAYFIRPGHDGPGHPVRRAL
jgi:hypothetical protein